MNLDISLGLVVAIALLFCIWEWREVEYIKSHASEFLTTLGILCCFIHVCHSLWHFDSGNIHKSVPILLDGVKKAFIFSAIGVGASLIAKAIFFTNKTEESESINTNEEFFQKFAEFIVESKKSSKLIANSMESSVSIQQESLNSLNDFGKHLAEDNQKLFLHSLTEAMTNFNNNLTEQFGENFKELNSAVKLLVDWQKQYKDELDTIKTVQAATSEDLKKSSDALTLIVSNSSEFANIAKNLGDAVISLSEAKDELGESLKDYTKNMKKVSKDVSEYIEKMKERSLSLTAQIQDTNVDITASIKKLADGVQKKNTELSNAMINHDKEINAVLSNSLQNIKDELGESLKDYTKNMKKVSTDVSEYIEKMKERSLSLTAQIQDTNVDITASIKKLAEGVQKNNKDLTNSITKHNDEINKVLSTGLENLNTTGQEQIESLARNLASLSLTFVKDYTPLTDRLRDILTIAEKIQS